MTQQNPGADMIEYDIVQTQNDMSDTVNELQDKLQPRQLLRQFVGNPQEIPTQVFDAVKRNPVAAGLIGVGAVWLLSGNQPKMPNFKRRSKTMSGHDEQIASVARYGGESEELYQARCAAARGDYLGVTRGTDEDAQSYRGRLDERAEGLGGKSKTGQGRIAAIGSAIKDRSRRTADWSTQKHAQAPLGMGVAAVTTGALFGLALPKTQIEREKLGPLHDTAIAKATELKDQALQAAGDKLGGEQPQHLS